LAEYQKHKFIFFLFILLHMACPTLRNYYCSYVNSVAAFCCTLLTAQVQWSLEAKITASYVLEQACVVSLQPEVTDYC